MNSRPPNVLSSKDFAIVRLAPPVGRRVDRLSSSHFGRLSIYALRRTLIVFALSV